jgi:hypothetical protein
MQDDADTKRREAEEIVALIDAHERVEALLEIMGIDQNPTLARIRAALGTLALAQIEGAL